MQKAFFCSYVMFIPWMQWIGETHLIFLHFPIALIIMTAISDFLFYWKKKTIFDQASLFMLYAAAIWTIPTVLSGLSLGYEASYTGILADFYQWHRALGIVLLFATFFVLALRKLNYFRAYYIGILCLVVLVTIIGALGGGLAFGLEVFQ